MAQRIKEEDIGLPAIEPEHHFVKVSRQMLPTDLVPSSDYAALQKREGILDGVGVDIPNDVDLFAMVDGFVLLSLDRSLLHCSWVGWEVIGHQDIEILANILADELSEGAGPHVLSMEETKFTIALPKTDNDLLGRFRFGHRDAFLPSANIGFVHFNCAV